jgi:hypothetical protein
METVNTEKKNMGKAFAIKSGTPTFSKTSVLI